jgi:hypothetical protein
MKKTLTVLMMVLLAAMLFLSCDNNTSEPKKEDSSTTPTETPTETPTTPTKPTYAVTFQLGEGIAPTDSSADFDAQDVVEGEYATKPATNPKANSKFQTFKFWSVDNGATEFKFDETPITEDIVLKAFYKDYEAGDIVSYGTYSQTYAIESLRTKAITWKILSVDTINSRMLVISENILEKGKHFDENSSAYSDSDIRAYLKGDFISTYGLSDVDMCNVDVTTAIETTTVGSGDDKVFLLSNTEANNTSYFANDSARVAYYDGTSWCWTLRTAYDGDDVYCVGNNNGSTGGILGCNSNNNGLRPAFWVNL